MGNAKFDETEKVLGALIRSLREKWLNAFET